MRKIIIISTFILALIISGFAPHGSGNKALTKVVIDAGHGGKDPGCLGATSKESKVALATALELGAMIKKNHPEIEVVYTRSTDVFVELYQRAKIANTKSADLFISIHCNSGPAAAYGTETYTMGMHTDARNLAVAKKENAVILDEEGYESNYEGFDPNDDAQYILLELYRSAYNDNSISLASKIENQFKSKLGRRSRGVKQAGLLVLWRTTMPSVLVEIGFLTNPKEEKYLNDTANRKKVATGIYDAFVEYKKSLDAE